MQIIDAKHPYFKPLWRRIAVVVACLGWALFEALNGQSLWAAAFAAIGFYSAWVLIFRFEPESDEDEDKK